MPNATITRGDLARIATELFLVADEKPEAGVIYGTSPSLPPALPHSFPRPRRLPRLLPRARDEPHTSSPLPPSLPQLRKAMRAWWGT